MKVRIPEPYIRPLESLTLPGQREAVERFMSGSSRESFTYGDATVIITEDAEEYVDGRSTIVTVTNSAGSEMLTVCVQDTKTHIAHRVNDTLSGEDGKGFGSVTRDTVEAIMGIPPFETAQICYLILFLIKRGYIPVGFIPRTGSMSQGNLYVEGLENDEKLQKVDIERIIQTLTEIYHTFQIIKQWPDSYGKRRRISQLKSSSFRSHLRLQYVPTVAKEIYQIFQSNEVYFFEHIDRVAEEILRVAYR